MGIIVALQGGNSLCSQIIYLNMLMLALQTIRKGSDKNYDLLGLTRLSG